MSDPRPLLLLPAIVATATLAACGPSAGLPHRDDLVSIDTDVLPDAATGSLYDAAVRATGPHPPLAWSVVGGRLPRGVTLDGDSGALSGWPREVGQFRVEVEVRDGADAALARDVTFAAARRRLDLRVVRGPIALPPFPLPPATFGSSYSASIEAVGGTAPYRFAVTSGEFPAGLTLDLDGTVRGVPREAKGGDRPTLRVTDVLGGTAERAFELAVVVRPLAVATLALPAAAAGFPYERSIDVHPGGGGPPYSWRVLPTLDAMPPGLVVDPSSGQVSGTPLELGTFPFRLEVTDAAGQTAGRDFSIRVNPGPVLESLSPAVVPKGGKPVNLIGQAFQSGMRVRFGTAPPVAASVLDATRATAVPPLKPEQSGPVDVTVENPDGGRDVLANGLRYPLATVEFLRVGVFGTGVGAARGLAAGDVDGDGRADLVHVGSDGIEMIRPPAAGVVGGWTTVAVRTSGSFNDVRLADVDADGDLDVVTLRSSSTETIEVYRNDGDGNFPSTASAVTSYPKPSGTHVPNTLACGDVDADGVVDVAFTSGRGGQGVLWVYRGLGDGRFVRVHEAYDSIWEAAGGCFGANGVLLADLDHDGRDDVVATDAFPNACAPGQACPATDGPNTRPGADDFVAWVALSDDAGEPHSWRVIRLGGTSGRLNGDNTGLAAYDHDGDGHVDLAVFGGYLDLRGAGVAFLRGDGSGGFSERFVRPTSYNRRYGARIDANLDDCDDLVVVGGDGRAGSGGARGYSVAEVFLGGLDPVPARAWTSGSESSASIPDSNPGRVAVGDFDGDGLDDFAVDQSFHAKERFDNDQDDGLVEGVSVWRNHGR